MEIFQAPEGSSEADELELLFILVKGYEDKHIFLPEIRETRKKIVHIHKNQ